MPAAHDFKAWINSNGPWKARGYDAAYAMQPLAAAHHGALIGHLDDVCGGTANRHKFSRYIFGVESSHDWTCRQRNALYLWLAPRHDEEAGRWYVSNERAYATARAVLATVAEQERQAAIDAGQLELPV